MIEFAMRWGELAGTIYAGYENTHFRIGIKLPNVTLKQHKRKIYKGHKLWYVFATRTNNTFD
jgi:hypothetical protein